MPRRMLLKALGIWLGILALAVANGAVREAVLIPSLGKGPGLVASGLVLSGLIVAIVHASLPWLGARSGLQLLSAGLGWLALTLVFELAFGLLRAVPMDEILAAYTFEDGNLWPVVLLVLVSSPWIAAKLRGWR